MSAQLNDFLNDTKILLPSAVNYATMYYKSKTVSGGCRAWQDVTQNLLVPPSDEFYVQQLSLVFETQRDINNDLVRDKLSLVCKDPIAVRTIVNELINGKDDTNAEHHCDNRSWRVFTCNAAKILCVDCKRKCVPTVTCPGALSGYVINPCEKQCETGSSGFTPNQANAWGVLSARFQQKILYPLFGSLNSSVVYRDRVTLAINVTKAGYVYCNAFAGSAVALSTVSLIRSPSAMKVEVTNARVGSIVYADVVGLISDQDYSIYCYTEDYVNHVMTISDVLNRVVRVRTACCGGIQLITEYNNIPEYLSRRRLLAGDETVSEFDVNHQNDEIHQGSGAQSIIDVPGTNGSFSREELKEHQRQLIESRQLTAVSSDPVFTFAIDSLPSRGSAVIKTHLHFLNCQDMRTFGSLIKAQQQGIVIPNVFTFSSKSASLAGNFIVRAKAGCYGVRFISQSLGGANVYNNGTYTVFRVVKSTQSPPLPQMKQVQLSNNGENIVIDFNANTDRAKTTVSNYLSADGFSCSSILTFKGSRNATCAWASSNQLVATFSPSASVARAQVGDSIQLNSGILKAECIPRGDLLQSVCDKANYATAISSPLLKPSIPMVPIIVLLVSDYISVCTDMAIDPRLTRGKGSLPWKSALWTIDVVDSDNPPNVVSVSKSITLSNRLFGLRSALLAVGTNLDQMIVLSKQFLTSGTRYRVTLTLTNYLGYSGYSEQYIQVAASTATPSVTINGLPSIEMFRYQTLSLQANASIALGDCTKVSSLVLNYQWKAFKILPAGMQFVADLVSTSLDNRIFALPAYVLDHASEYKVQVTVTVPSPTGEGAIGWSSASVSVLVGKGALKPVILGGAVQAFSAMETDIWLDGRSSYDSDYPIGNNPQGLLPLTYIWTCEMRSPVVGGPCLGMRPSQKSSPYFNLVTFDLALRDVNDATIILEDYFEAGTYLFVLKVTNSFGSATVSSILTLLNSEVPTVSIIAPATKFDVGDKVIITASIKTKAAATASWRVLTALPVTSTGSSLDLASISATPLSISFPTPVTSVFQLTLKPDMLAAGAQYTFELKASYKQLNSSMPDAAVNIQTVTIAMNIPPRQGVLSVSPSIGTALTTKFSFSTKSWMDEDYPILYKFSYFLLAEDTQYQVKEYNLLNYAFVPLAGGLEQVGFTVRCLALAKDIYGSVGKAYAQVIVKPISKSNLQTAADSTFNTAFQMKDPNLVGSVTSAVTAAVNLVSCVVPVPCNLLNRLPCSSVPRTCGPCIGPVGNHPGYVGVDGPSNTYCGDMTPGKNKLLPAGALCTPGFGNFSYCASNSCNSNYRCDVSTKRCKNDCSNNGDCLYYDQSGAQLTEAVVWPFSRDPPRVLCLSTDKFCQPKCSCRPNFYGSDCSLTYTNFMQLSKLRDNLCENLYKTISFQDVDKEVIVSRCTTVAEVLQDLDQISDYALVTCTAVLATTVIDNPDIVGAASTSNIVAQALSAVLAKGSSLSQTLRDAVQLGIEALSIGAQSNLAVGEEPMHLKTSSMSGVTGVGNSASLSNSSFTVPESSYQSFEKSRTPSIAVSINETRNVNGQPVFSGIAPGSALGVTVLQYSMEEGGKSSGNASSVSLATQLYSGSGTVKSQSRRLIANEEGIESLEFVGLNGFSYSFPSFKGVNWLASLAAGIESVSNSGSGQAPMQIISGGPITSHADDARLKDIASTYLGKVNSAPMGNGIAVEVVLYNKIPVTYSSLPAERNEIICYKIQDEPYTVTGTCSNGYSYSVECPGRRAVFNNTCPGYTDQPVCTVFDDSLGKFVPTPLCTVTKFDSLSTTCRCSSGIAGRRLLNDHEVFGHNYAVNGSNSIINGHSTKLRRLTGTASSNSFSAQLITVHTELLIAYYETISYKSVKNGMILSTVGLFVLIFVFGLVMFAWTDDYEKRQLKAAHLTKKKSKEGAQLDLVVKAKPIDDSSDEIPKLGLLTLTKNNSAPSTARSEVSVATVKSKDSKKNEKDNSESQPITPGSSYSRRISDFFDSLLPDEFRPGRGHVLLKNRILLEHTWLSMFAPFREDADGRGVRWAIAMLGRIASYIFFITILAASQFADDNSCENIIDFDLCVQEATPIVRALKCSWDSYAKACYFTPPALDPLTIILYGLAVYIFVAPVAKLQEIFIMEATKLPWFPFSPFLVIENFVYKVCMGVYNFVADKFKKPAPVLLSEEELDKIIAAKMQNKPVSVSSGVSDKIVPIDDRTNNQMNRLEERELNEIVDKPEDAKVTNSVEVTPKKDLLDSPANDRPFGLETPNANLIETMKLPPSAHVSVSEKSNSAILPVDAQMYNDLRLSEEKMKDVFTPKSGTGSRQITPLSSARSHTSNSSKLGAVASKYNLRPDLSISLGLDTIEESTPEALAVMNKVRQHDSDEFFKIQTIRGKLLRAARLTKAQTVMEFATPHEEASLLARRIYKDRKRANNFIVSTMVSNVDIPRVKSRYEDNIDDEVLRYGTMSDEKIIASVVHARMSSIKINKEIEQMRHEEDREMHLMRHFFIDNLSGYSRGVAPRYLFNRNTAAETNVESSVTNKLAEYSRQFFYIGLMVGVTGVQFLYVMVSGGAILGSKASPLWITMLAYCVLLDAVFMQFAIIFFKCVLLRATFVTEISWLAQILKNHTRVIMMRTFGNLRDAASYQQHLNPACRVARMHPHLPISRLLLSINDADVPIPSDDTKKRYEALSLLPVYWRINSFMAFVATLPHSVQDTINELSCIILSNVIAVALYLVAQVSFDGAIGMAALLLCVFNRAYFYRFYRWLGYARRNTARRIKDALKYKEPGRQPEDEANEFDSGEEKEEDIDMTKLSPEKQLEYAMKKSLKMKPQGKPNVMTSGFTATPSSFGSPGSPDSPDNNNRLIQQNKSFSRLGSQSSPLLSPLRSLQSSPDVLSPMGDSTYGQLGPPVDYASPMRGSYPMKSGLAPPKGTPSRAPYPQSIKNVSRAGLQPTTLMSQTQPAMSVQGLEVNAETDTRSGGKFVPPAARRPVRLPSLLDAPPISGSTSPYRHRHENAGYGAHTLFQANTPEPFTAKKSAISSDLVKKDAGLSGFGLSSIESIELVPGLNDSKKAKEMILPEAAIALFDTTGQEDIVAIRTELDDPLLKIDPLGNTVIDRDPSPSRRRAESRERRESPDKHRSHKEKRYDRDRDRDRDRSRDKDRDRSRDRDRDRDRPKTREKGRHDGRGREDYDDEDAFVHPMHGNLGHHQKLSEEEKARRRVQARLNRRHKASMQDLAIEDERRNEEQEKERLEYLAQREERDKERAPPIALDRNAQSIDESARDHFRRNHRSSKRHKNEQAERESDSYLETRAGPGDRSISNLERERPVESALFRNGLMLLDKDEDGSTPKLNLAFDAHDYDGAEGARIRVANQHREPRVMPLSPEEGVPLRTVSRDKRSSLLGSARDMRANGGSRPIEGPPVPPSPYGVSPNKPPSKQPVQGPGPRIPEFPSLDDKEPPAVVVKPAQKYPMWTT